MDRVTKAKVRLYRELLLRDPEKLTSTEMDLQFSLSEDHDIQRILEKARTGELDEDEEGEDNDK